MSIAHAAIRPPDAPPKPLRLLLAIEPCEYGVFGYVRDLIGYLAAKQPEIAVDLAYSTRRSSPPLAPLVAEVEARGGRTFDMKVGNAPERGDWTALGTLRRLTRERGHHIVHAHSSKAGALTRLSRLRPGFPPVIYTPNAYYGMSRRGGLREAAYNGIERVLSPLGWTHLVSSYERDFACGRLGVPARSTVLIYTGIDLRVFAPAGAEEKAALRRELGLPVTGKILVTLGRHSPQKNLEPLYAALERLLPGADWSFAHAGSGSPGLRAGLSPAAAARAHAFEHLDRSYRLLRAGDGFILPSLMEGFSIAGVEALACGLPMIITASTGFLSLRKLGFDGIRWLPDPATSGDITPAIVAALEDWSGAPAFDPGPQRRRVEGWFDGEVQWGKLVRAYRHFARD